MTKSNYMVVITFIIVVITFIGITVPEVRKKMQNFFTSTTNEECKPVKEKAKNYVIKIDKVLNQLKVSDEKVILRLYREELDKIKNYNCKDVEKKQKSIDESFKYTSKYVQE